MKRLYVHPGVADLEQSMGFYSTLIAAKPTVQKDAYAKWMIEDPRLSFAISSGQHAIKSIEHLGIQVESFEQLSQVCDRLKAADRPVLEEGATTCCYAKSDKSWVSDPDGVVWKALHTNGEATVYGDSPAVSALSDNAAEASCCAPVIPAKEAEQDACCDETTPQGVCCEPKTHLPADAPCCG